jgi:hypothetical protein
MDISDSLRRMDLNLVLPLDALLEERHVTRAAERWPGCGGCSVTRCWSATGGCTS